MREAMALPQMGMGMAMVGAAAYVAWAQVAQRTLPLISGIRPAFWAVVGLGMLACAVGGIGTGLARAGGSWGDPFIIGGAVLGTVALAVVASFALRFDMPLLGSDGAKLVALAVLIAAKFGWTTLHALVAAAR